MAEGDTLTNAVIGAAVTVVGMAFIPFSPLFGGGVAGYLQGGERADGLRVGLVSGLLSLIPGAFVAFFVLALVGVVSIGAGDALFGVFGIGVFALVMLFEGVYAVGLSAAGGWLGNYVKYDTDVEF